MIVPADDVSSGSAFVGKGEIAGRPWWRSDDDKVAYAPPVPESTHRALADGHPAAYEASEELIAAVNTALLLQKPLLVTGKPGTGKTELAERIAYEFDLGPVLRFESQSLSEANDLFYRFDHIAHLVAARLVESGQGKREDADVMKFIQFGPLGKAILRSVPGLLHRLNEDARRLAAGDVLAPGVRDSEKSLLLGSGADGQTTPLETARRSVVLIDEIDKASRDFPNDLLNGIDRMEFRVRELGSAEVRGAGRDSGFNPIVIITSNSERDLPNPFMRRCVFAHIPDPGRDQLAAIVRKRVFGDYSQRPGDDDGLPPLYSQLLSTFVSLRDDENLHYPIGTSELLDIATVARRHGITGFAFDESTIAKLRRAVGAIAKHHLDREVVLARLPSVA